MNDIIKSDFQKIVDFSLNHAEHLMSELTNIYPFGATIDFNDTITPVNVWDGNDYPNSTDVINNLKTVFERNLKVKLKVTAITYNVLAIDPNDQIKKDALAIRVQHAELEEPRIFFFPYQTINKKLTFSKSWGELEKSS